MIACTWCRAPLPRPFPAERRPCARGLPDLMAEYKARGLDRAGLPLGEYVEAPRLVFTEDDEPLILEPVFET